MNPQLTSDLATGRARDLQHAAERHRTRSAGRDSSATPGGHRPPGLRHRIGFTLVEAGLLLLAGAGPDRPGTAPAAAAPGYRRLSGGPESGRSPILPW